MFVLRGIAVSLTFFVLLYSLLSLLVGQAWRVAQYARSLSAASLANLLFLLRVFPLFASTAVTLVLVIPAYVRLEPRSIEEDIALPLLLALGCVLLFALGVFRVIKAQTRTARVVSAWLKDASPIDAGIPAPTFLTRHDTPPLTLVGVGTPRVVISAVAYSMLDPYELRVSVQHELAHMRSRDNLKRLFMYCAPFPGMGGLEKTWQKNAELAADDRAVGNKREALDLASALIKLSRSLPAQSAPHFTSAAAAEPSLLRSRVARLLAWSGTQAQSGGLGWICFPPTLIAVLLYASAQHEPVLARIHQICEWLVR